MMSDEEEQFTPEIVEETISEKDCKFVCSRGILKSCHIRSSKPVSSTRILMDYDLSKLFPGCVVYVCGSAIPHFFNIIQAFPCNIILVTGDCDETIPTNVFPDHSTFSTFVESEKIIHWFSQNFIFQHPKVTQLPIGLDYHTMSVKDHEWGSQSTPAEQETILEEIAKNAKPFYERHYLAYSNFHFFMTTKFGQDRVDATQKIPRELVYYEPTKVPRAQSWKTQSEYAFVISPHGNGLDCHRTWEALCLGCIPIVKSSPLDGLFQDLPVYIVSDWGDVTEQSLRDIIEKYKTQTFQYEKLTLKYWMDKINNASR